MREMLVRDKMTIDDLIGALNAVDEGIAICDAEKRALFVNDAYKKRTPSYAQALAEGKTTTEALTSSVRAALPHLSAEEATSLTLELEDRFYAGESVRTKTETGAIIESTLRVLPNGLGITIASDVSARVSHNKALQKATKAAEAANDSKSTFLANMSHEIRTPLNGILGMAQVLSKADLESDHKEHVATIIESGKTLMSLLNDVLDLSKIEAGKFDIVRTDTDIRHVLRRVHRLWKPRATEKGIALRFAFDSEMPEYVSLDPVRMQQCVSNLVSNAIKFTDEGEVIVYTYAAPSADGRFELFFEISDTGPGMSKEVVTQLFKPFAQADQTISRKHGGTGLGLSIVKNLAELMGGSAKAQSEPGRGSKFTFSLIAEPASAPPQRRASDRQAMMEDDQRALKTSGLRVLLVDDQPINRQIVTLFLRPFKMEIAEASDGKQALELLQQNEFDVVLLDMHMPIMDGPTTIRQIRDNASSFQNVPVVALTADAMNGDRDRYLAMGMDAYLAKPLAERELISTLSQVRSMKGRRGSPDKISAEEPTLAPQAADQRAQA